MAPPVLNQLNLVVTDIDAALAFYRLLGLDIPDGPGEWPQESGARHTETTIAGGPGTEFELSFDNQAMAAI